VEVNSQPCAKLMVNTNEWKSTVNPVRAKDWLLWGSVVSKCKY